MPVAVLVVVLVRALMELEMKVVVEVEGGEQGMATVTTWLGSCRGRWCGLSAVRSRRHR